MGLINQTPTYLLFFPFTSPRKHFYFREKGNNKRGACGEEGRMKAERARFPTEGRKSEA